jgi:hypothetical protein
MNLNFSEKALEWNLHLQPTFLETRGAFPLASFANFSLGSRELSSGPQKQCQMVVFGYNDPALPAPFPFFHLPATKNSVAASHCTPRRKSSNLSAGITACSQLLALLS